MKVSDYITNVLLQHQVFHVFGYPGGNITHLIDSICEKEGIHYVQTSHEQGASFAANGYAQTTNNLGVAITSSGPGALNLVTGIANAYFDSIPVLFISGDLSKKYKKGSQPIRQDGFQSTDIVSVVKSITKYAVSINTPDEVPSKLAEALYHASHGRKGPSYISIPHWIQGAEIDDNVLKTNYNDLNTLSEVEVIDELDIVRLFPDVKTVKKPLILIGGGCCNPQTKEELVAFIDKTQLPFVSSLCGISALSHDNPNYVGYIGDYGNRHANLALANSDCLIVLGSRMDERQIKPLTMGNQERVIIHVDIDSSELYEQRSNYIPLNTDVLRFIRSNSQFRIDEDVLSSWKNSINGLSEKYPKISDDNEYTVSAFLTHLSKILAHNCQIFTDVGTHQMSCAQHIHINDQRMMYVSGGLGSMGYAVPASIGGFLSCNKTKETICITGDGGFLMSLNELQTIQKEKLNIKIIVINNNCLGMIRDYQSRNFNGRNYGSVDGYMACNVEKVSDTFGFKYLKVQNSFSMNELERVLKSDYSAIIEVVFTQDMEAYPNGINYEYEHIDL